MTVTIRPAEATDLEILEAIERESFTSPHWKREDFVKYDCLVAEYNGKIAGFLVSRDLFPGDAANPAQREILNVAIATGFRRKGLATLLINKILARSGEVFLEVRESNVIAQSLYCKLGFVEVGRRTHYYQNPDEAAIVMKVK